MVDCCNRGIRRGILTMKTQFIIPIDDTLCHFRMLDKSSCTIKTYTCREMKKGIAKLLLSEFREKNASERIEKSCGVDKPYEYFKKEIVDFLNKCYCEGTIDYSKSF
jgi:hypothetical protein